MSERGEATARQVRKALQEVARLREQGAHVRLGQPAGGPLPLEKDPPGGWQPILDDDGNVIPDPPPSEPTDVPPDYLGEG